MNKKFLYALAREAVVPPYKNTCLACAHRDEFMANKDESIDVIRLWALKDDFFSLPLEAQYSAIKHVTSRASPLTEPRQPCPISLADESLMVAFFLLTLGFPALLIFGFAVAFWYGSLQILGSLALFSLLLAFHPIARNAVGPRSSRLAMALIRYLSLEVLADRGEPFAAAIGTSAIDSADFQANHLPALYLACPHGVFNYGAIAWCCISRWLVGCYQYTGAAAVLGHVPGLRYMDPLLWSINAGRKQIQQVLRARTPPGQVRRDGMLGMVPDGILGAFRSRPGFDELIIGKKRGLLRIASEEGATVYAAWFFGTSDLMTVIQDPWGIMESISRKIQAGILIPYGRWGLPIPRRVAVTTIVVPYKCEKRASPTDAEVEEVHQAVYGALVSTYNRQKKYAGYADRTLLVK